MIACDRRKVYAIHIMYSARRMFIFYFISYFWYSRCSYKEGYVLDPSTRFNPDICCTCLNRGPILTSVLFISILWNFKQLPKNSNYHRLLPTCTHRFHHFASHSKFWWRLFEKRIGCTKLDIYVFITDHI